MKSTLRNRVLIGLAGALTALTAFSTMALAADNSKASESAAESATLPPFAVEDFAYPNAEDILADKGIKLFRGDGHILLDECDGSADQIEVWTRQTADGKYCFRATATSGYLKLEVPDVYAFQTKDRPISADLTSNGETETVDVAEDQFKGVGEGAGDDPTVLVELRVTG